MRVCRHIIRGLNVIMFVLLGADCADSDENSLYLVVLVYG